jgi:hypothetical protein
MNSYPTVYVLRTVNINKLNLLLTFYYCIRIIIINCLLYSGLAIMKLFFVYRIAEVIVELMFNVLLIENINKRQLFPESLNLRPALRHWVVCESVTYCVVITRKLSFVYRQAHLLIASYHECQNNREKEPRDQIGRKTQIPCDYDFYYVRTLRKSFEVGALWLLLRK